MNRCSNKKEAVTEDLGAEHSRQRTTSAKASLALNELMETKGASVVLRSEQRGEEEAGDIDKNPILGSLDFIPSHGRILGSGEICS